MFIHAYRVPVEMEPKKWSNQAAFVLLVCSSPERPIIWRKDVEVKTELGAHHSQSRTWKAPEARLGTPKCAPSHTPVAAASCPPRVPAGASGPTAETGKC